MEQTVDETVELLENDEFFLYLKSFFAGGGGGGLMKGIVHEKDVFLLSDLLEDIKRLSELSGLTEPIILNTRTLKKKNH